MTAALTTALTFYRCGASTPRDTRTAARRRDDARRFVFVPGRRYRTRVAIVHASCMRRACVVHASCMRRLRSFPRATAARRRPALVTRSVALMLGAAARRRQRAADVFFPNGATNRLVPRPGFKPGCRSVGGKGAG